MALCAGCQKKLGIFAEARKLGPEKQRYCPECAEKWYREEKERAIRTLYERSAPQEFFSIHKVMMRDPDVPDKQTLLGGDLVFLDKAVCFAALMEHKPPSATVAVVFFGVIGSAWQQSKASKALKAAWAAVPGGGEVRTASGLAEFLYRSRRLYVFPRREVIAVGFGFWAGFRVKTVHKAWPMQLEDSKKTWRAHRDKVGEYLIGRLPA